MPNRTICIDADLLEGIIKELLHIEAWAKGLQESCYKTRQLIHKTTGVSTPAKDEPALSDQELALLSWRRRKRRMKGLK